MYLALILTDTTVFSRLPSQLMPPTLLVFAFPSANMSYLLLRK